MRNQYVANGSCSNFPFSFPTESAADVEVLVDDVATGCTVSGAGSPLGGGVVLVSPPAAGSVVVVRHRGEVTVSDSDARSGHLADKLVAGTGASLTVQTAADGFQTVVVSGPETADFARKSQNLADLADAAQARSNLGLGSAAIRDVGTDAGEVVALDAQAKLPAVDGSQLTNIPFGKVKASDTDTIADFLDAKLVAGANVTITEVAGVSDKALEISAATDPAVIAQLAALSGEVSGLSSGLTSQSAVTGALSDLLSTVIWNQGVLALRSQIGAGWSVLKMVDGIADEFEDESGVDTSVSINENYNSAGDFYSPVIVLAYGSNFISGGSASASATGEGASPPSACDGNTDTLWGPPNFTTDAWWQYDLGAGNGKIARKMRLYSSDILIKDFTLKGSVDGSTWVDLLSGRFPAALGWNEWTFANSTSYRYYRLHGTSSWNTSVGFMEIELIEATGVATVENMTLISQPVAAEAQPSETRLLLLHQPVDAVAVNTDLIAEVSRDDGETWTAVALADMGAFDTVTRVLAGSVDLSAQQAGTAMRWKVTTHNAKEQRLHGVWLQWR